ncbi:phosphopantetheine-binding protein [Lipingzhangella sp. LS1_29]|uniref:Phosphopantetheine-binding protein n=1 Tax=Lipingzhangella rawalii TaxID=2055835 RepID=A0ABU2H6I8_9ACTN|nr:phosphopantetheine-binding protein [Lipingzhangella rawalii]MDS1270913.1 phosphopantetheine-binding protein [Lipingzhangella rawalii]
MIDEAEFLELLDEELGLRVTPEDLTCDLDALEGWDSLHLLRLMSALESRTGRGVRLTDVIEATTLGQVLDAVVRDG